MLAAISEQIQKLLFFYGFWKSHFKFGNLDLKFGLSDPQEPNKNEKNTIASMPTKKSMPKRRVLSCSSRRTKDRKKRPRSWRKN